MKRTVVLHIGPHKTGTTYIQQAFSEASAVLAQHHIYYPLDEQENGYGQHKVVQQLRDDHHSPLLAKFLQDCPAGHDLFLSSESFSRLTPAAVAGMAKQLQGCQVVVLYTVRPVADALFSNWQQQVKVGIHETWAEFLLGHLAQPRTSQIVNPMASLDAFRKAFPNSIRLLDYAGIVESGKNIANAVIEAGLGRELPEFSAGAANPSLPLSVAEIIRALNIIYARSTGAPSKGFKVYRVIRKVLRKSPEDLAALKSRVEAFSAEFDPAQLCADLPIRREFMAAYGECFVGPRATAAPKVKQLKLPSSAWLQDTQTLNQLEQLYTQLDFEPPRGARRRKSPDAQDAKE
jgi:hypothetical protein